MKKITIAIPHYKAVESLKRLLNALENQNFNKNEFEVLVVNDGAESRVKRNKLGDFSFELKIINKKHGGVASARNSAIKTCSTDFIFFLDQDCIPQKEWLKNMANRFKKENYKVAAIGGFTMPIANKGIVNEYFNISNSLGVPIVDKKTGEIVTIITANAGFRSKALKSVDGFDAKIFNALSYGGEDVDLTYRLKKIGYSLIFEPTAIVLHEYPNKFNSIFFKYVNYGRGMRLFCLVRNINPKLIRQPGFNIISFLKYLPNVAKKVEKAYKGFRQSKGLLKSIIFSFFELVKFTGHIYGYFYGPYKIRMIK